MIRLSAFSLKAVYPFFDNEEVSFVNQSKSSLGECYCRSGDQEAGEKVIRELIRQYPDRVVGYIAMEMAFSIRKMNGHTAADEDLLKILEDANNYPVIDGESYDLDRRISFLKQEIANFEAKI